MRSTIIYAMSSILADCAVNPNSQTHQYQLVPAPSGQLYRLDAVTGEVINVEKIVSSSERMELQVGSFYETEDGEVVRYIGKGKLVPRPPLSEFFK